MFEKPPLTSMSGEPLVEQMTLEQLEQKIKELSEELDDLLKRNQGGRGLEAQISAKINERAHYIMEKQKRLASGV